MSRQRTIGHAQPVPADGYFNAIQEWLSTYASPNFVVTILNPTTLQVVAGADNAKAGVAINGHWRYNESTVLAAAPGGLVVGDNPVFVTGAANNIGAPPGTGLPEVDSTDYTFYLAVLPAATVPSGTGSAALYRQVAVATWNGSAFTDVRMTLNGGSTSVLPKHATTHNPGGSDALSWVAIAGTILLRGTLGARPAAGAGNANFLYVATDVNGGTPYQSDGASWTKIAMGATETLSNTGVATAILLYGTLAARPAAAAGNNGFYYWSSDVQGGTIHQSTGAAWVQRTKGLTEAPVAHAASHNPGGSDALDYVAIPGVFLLRGTLAARPAAAAGNNNWYFFATDSSGGTLYQSSGSTWVQLAKGLTALPVAHASTHQPGGADPMTVDAATNVGSLRTLGFGATQAMPGNTTLGATVATTVAGLGAAVDGKIGLIRAGSSPYDFKQVVYDATYGKWVSAVEPVANGGGSSAQTSNASFVEFWGSGQGNQPIGPIVWANWNAAGLKPTFRWGAWMSLGGAATGAMAAQIGYTGLALGQQYPSAGTWVTATQITTSSHSDVWEESGWAPVASPVGVDVYMRIGQRVKSDGSGANASVNHIEIAMRWEG